MEAGVSGSPLGDVTGAVRSNAGNTERGVWPIPDTSRTPGTSGKLDVSRTRKRGLSPSLDTSWTPETSGTLEVSGTLRAGTPGASGGVPRGDRHVRGKANSWGTGSGLEETVDKVGQ